MRKVILLLLTFLAVSIPLSGTEHDIRISKDDHHTGSRTSPDNWVTATYDDETGYLYFTFSNATASKTLVYSANDSQTALIQQSSLSGLSTTADISSLPIGNYVVEIYAFDCWWIGYFEIE